MKKYYKVEFIHITDYSMVIEVSGGFITNSKGDGSYKGLNEKKGHETIFSFEYSNIERISKEEYEALSKQVIKDKTEFFNSIKINDIFNRDIETKSFFLCYNNNSTVVEHINYVVKYKYIENNDIKNAHIIVCCFDGDGCIVEDNFGINEFGKFERGDIITFSEPKEIHEENLSQLFNYKVKLNGK